MTRTPRRAGISVLLIAFVIAIAAAQQGSAHDGPHGTALSGMSLDVLADGKVVVTMAATGEYAGTVTFQFQPNGSGTFDGEWAFTVAHADNTDPETGLEPDPDEGEPHDHSEGTEPNEPGAHKDFLRLVQRGALGGSIAGAELTFNAQGALTALTAPLTIAQGFNEFDGVTGSGEATLDALTLTF
jgi:hypothetical protein